MKVDEIIGKLTKAGFEQSRAYNIVNITTEGGWLTGKYLGTQEYKDEDGDVKVNQKFEITDGEGLMGADAEKITKIPAGEYIIFGSGLLNWILANNHKTGETVAVVYKGKEPFVYKGKKIKSHKFEVMAMAK